MGWMDSAELLFRNSSTRKVAWEIINEPDNHPVMGLIDGVPTPLWVTSDSGVANDFFDYWKRMVRAIRTRDPQAQIVGPSINNFVKPFLCRFVKAARDSSVLPDYLSWHEMSVNWETPDSIPVHTAWMRLCMDSLGIRPTLPISINEFGEMTPRAIPDSLSPGREVKYLAALERADVHSAMRSCWGEMDGGLPCSEGTIVGMLTKPVQGGIQKPRSVYHVYSEYGNLRGRSLRVTPGEAGMTASPRSTPRRAC